MNQSLTELDSRNLLLDQLSKAERSILIGKDIESPVKFFLLRTPSTKPLEVGIISNQSKSIDYKLLPNKPLLIIGHDQFLTAIDTTKGIIDLNEQLDGIFFEFLIDAPRHQLLAIHELGIASISFEGRIQWQYSSPDILENWEIVNNKIKLSAMNEDPILVDLSTGTQIPFPF